MLTEFVSSDLSLREKIGASDVRTTTELCFKSMVGNRPDSEGTDQLTLGEIQSLAAPGVEQAKLPE